MFTFSLIIGINPTKARQKAWHTKYIESKTHKMFTFQEYEIYMDEFLLNLGHMGVGITFNPRAYNSYQ